MLANCNGESGSPAAPSVFGPGGSSLSGATVHGRVSDSSGAGANTLSFAPADTVSGDGAAGLTVEIADTGGLSAVVGDDGEFTISDVPRLDNVVLIISGGPGGPVNIDLDTPLAENETLEVELIVDAEGNIEVDDVEIEDDSSADGDSLDDDSSDDPSGDDDPSPNV